MPIGARPYVSLRHNHDIGWTELRQYWRRERDAAVTDLSAPTSPAVIGLEVAATVAALVLPVLVVTQSDRPWNALLVVLAVPAATSSVAAWRTSVQRGRTSVTVSAWVSGAWTLALLPAYGAGLIYAPSAILASVAWLTDRRRRRALENA